MFGHELRQLASIQTPADATVITYGCVWGKIWRGKKKVRGEEDAVLHGLVERRGNTVGSWTFSRGWVEEWVVDGTGEVLRFTRASPSRDGWKIVALGIRDIEGGEQETYGWFLGALKEVVEVWVQGQVNREIAIATLGMGTNHRYIWYL